MAQTTFSISPLVNYKLLICSYPTDQSFGFYSENQQINPQNPYYNFYAKRISHRPSINIGLRLDASLDNEKYTVMGEWSQDATGTMSKTTSLNTTNTYGLPDPPYKTYSDGVNYFQNGFVFNRFSLFGGLRITKQEFLTKVWILLDYSLAITKSNQMFWNYENFSENNSEYYYNNAKWVKTETQAEIYKGVYSLIGVGLKADVFLKFNSNPTYIFTAETHFRQGLRLMSHGSETTVIDDNGEILAFLNTLSSKGSGIYFQISRRFKIPKRKK
jgi:hypothetical protein